MIVEMNSTTYYTIRFNERDSNRGKREYRMFRDSFVDEFSITLTIFLILFEFSKTFLTTHFHSSARLFYSLNLIVSLRVSLNLSRQFFITN